MKNRPKLSKKGKSVAVAMCFVAAVAIVGTYTFQNAQTEQQKSTVTAKKDDTEETKSANTDKLVIDTGKDSDHASESDDSMAKEQETERNEAEKSEGTSAAPIEAVNETAGTGVALNFTEDSEILWPVNGQVLMDYSMDKTVFFKTLDQYKYNPALIIGAVEGDQVLSGAAGVVKSIDVTAQTGTTVNLDLGNGYEVLIGQLGEVPVKVGQYVNANTVVGYVAAPTKYYALEGSNVYYEMRKDGMPVNPVEYVGE